MVSALDVAAYILEKMHKTTAMKLQKLVYYSQAWSLVWDGEQLFSENIQAWANGPVVRELYDVHKGMYSISSISGGDPSKLSNTQKETVDAVLEYYGDKSPQWLSDLTHMEEPWRKARAGLPETERSERVIKLSDMEEYYGSLSQEDE